MAGFQSVLILCPPHLIRKWKREIEDTVPNGRAAIVTSISDLERLRLSTGAGPLFAIMSRERAKLSYRWKPAVIQRWATAAYNGYGGRLVRDEETRCLAGDGGCHPPSGDCWRGFSSRGAAPSPTLPMRRFIESTFLFLHRGVSRPARASVERGEMKRKEPPGIGRPGGSSPSQ